ncbi:hypothetical protein D9M68_542980 [compost metagenome]
MGGVAADALGQGDAHRLGQHQAAGQVEVLAHARSVHFQAGDDQQRLLQRAGGQAAEFGQGFPFGMPETEAALVLLGHGGEHGGDQARRAGGGADQHGGAHRVALVRHGGGTALARRRRFEDFTGLGLHQEAQVAAELAQAAGDQAEQAGEFHQPVALGVPGLLGQVQGELAGQGLGHRPGLFAQGGQAAGGAAELQAEQARLQLGQSLAMAGDGAQHPGQLHAQGHGGGLLQPGAPGQGRIGEALGLHGQGLGQAGEVLLQQRGGGAQLQHQAAVHGVLAGGAEVDVTFGFGALGSNALAQGLHQRNGGVAGAGDGLGQGGVVVEFGLAGGGYGRHGVFRDQAHAGLGTRQGRLEVQHALHAPLVGEDRAHGGLGEVGIEELVARAVQASAPEFGMVFRFIAAGRSGPAFVAWNGRCARRTLR